MPSLKYMFDVIERLDGAGLTIENPEIVKEELLVMGFTDDEEENDGEYEDE